MTTCTERAEELGIRVRTIAHLSEGALYWRIFPLRLEAQ